MDNLIKKQVYKTTKGAEFTLYFIPGKSQYIFKRSSGTLHKSLQGAFTSISEAEKRWKFYVKTAMRHPRTSKNLKELGEKDDPDFILNKPVEIVEEEEE